jgi:hypothetical protein
MRNARVTLEIGAGLLALALLCAPGRAAAKTCSAAACDDGNPCTTDTCQGNKCAHTALNAGESCVLGGVNGTCHIGNCCTGCWNGSTCQPGTGKLACGRNGANCGTCGVDCLGDCSTGTCNAAQVLPNGTTCSSGTGQCWGGACCAGAKCWNGVACVDGTTNAACGSLGNMCAPCSSDDCGAFQTCSGGVCAGSVASETAPPAACVIDSCHSVTCDGNAGGTYCASYTRPVCTADCRGSLGDAPGAPRNAYPAGFTQSDFRAWMGVQISTTAITSIPPDGTGGSSVGHVLSRNISRELSQWVTNEQAWMLSKVHVKYRFERPLGCTSADRIDVSLAIDEVGTGGGAQPVPIQITDMPSATAPPAPFVIPVAPDSAFVTVSDAGVTSATSFVAEQVYDLLTWGHKGTRLRWQADFVNASGCTGLALKEVDIGYQAMLNDDVTADSTYKLRSYSSLIPLANMMYFGAVETPAAAWGAVTGGDADPRGHLIAQSYYEPEDVTTQVVTTRWDAGEELRQQHPGARRIFTMDDTGATIRFSPTNFNGTQLAFLKEQVLPSPERGVTDPAGNLVFDFDHNGSVTDNDALAVMSWTLGCALFAADGTTPQPAATCTDTTRNPVRRPWPLGAIDRGMPAIIGPPNMPWWLNGNRIPPSMRDAYWTWAADPARQQRDTIAYVGAQDGMLHAFYAGNFFPGDDPSTANVEYRGYFAKTGSTTRDYGGRANCQTRHASDGTAGACPERFAYVPRALLPQLRNAVTTPASGKSWTYAPSSHTRAAIDASPLVEDVVTVGTDASGNPTYDFRTILFTGVGPLSPYIIAVDVTDPSNPMGLWEQRYENFRGTLKNPPSSAMSRMPAGDQQVVIFNSGFGWQLLDPYFFVIDATDGTLIAQLPAATTAGEKSFGTLSSPLLIDMDNDGYVERAYMLDTGRASDGTLFWRVVRLSLRPSLGTAGPTNPQVCEIARGTGEGAFGGLAGYVCDPSDPTGPCATNKVRLYFATSDDPRWDDGTSGKTYHGYAYVDEDLEPDLTHPNDNPPCNSANHTQQFAFNFDQTGTFPEKSWITPAIDMNYVYYATLRSPTDSECDFSSSVAGRIIKLDLNGADSPTVRWQQALTVQPIGAVRVYDQHVFLGTTAGTPSISAETGAKFGNTPQNPKVNIKVGDAYWAEPDAY